MTRRLALLAVLSALSCGSADTPGTGFGAGPGTVAGDTGSSTGAGTDTTSSFGSSGSTGHDTSTGPALDSSTGMELPPDFGPVGPEGCKGKIDFLFVLGNSGLMAPYQARLHASLDDFIKVMEGQFADFDPHVMVVETDSGWHMDDCSLCGPGCDPDGELPKCGAELDACDFTMGAGVVFPAGKDSSARRCDLVSGRYLTRDDPDLASAFLCIARVGSGGGDPRAADAMVAALSPPLLGTQGYPAGCNQGFLRDDALLVVTIISGEYEEYSSGPAEAWRKALMDAKHQDGEAFQLLVITADNDIVGGLCGDYSGVTNRLRTFVNIVPNGKIGSICADSYGPYFGETASEILKRCDSFVPQ